MSNANGLTPAQTEALSLLAEECAEVVQCVTKILRHGLDSSHPNDPRRTANHLLLAGEIGDLLAAIDIAFKNINLSAAECGRAYEHKLGHVTKWLHHAVTL